MTEDDFQTISCEYELYEGYEAVSFDEDSLRFECPSCGEFSAVKHSGKLIGECLECGVDLQFAERSTMFVREA